MTAALLLGCVAGYCGGAADPVEDGRKLSEPSEALFPLYSLPEQSSEEPIAFVLPADRSNHLSTAWLDEKLRKSMLEDRLVLFAPQPAPLASYPSSSPPVPDFETLASMVFSVVDSR